MRQFVAVFDNAPLEASAWMKETAAACGLYFVDQDTLARALSEDAGFQKSLMSPQVKNFANPHQHPSLAKYYQAALEKVAPAAKHPRVALHGWGWLVFADKVHACVFDFAGFDQEQKRVEKTRKHSPAQVVEHFEKTKAVLRDQAKKKLFPDKILELPAAAPDAEKAKKATEFLKKMGA